MNIDEILKTIGACLGVASGLYTLWRLAWSDKHGKWGRVREDYKFSKEFLTELNDKKSMSAYQKAKGYQALSGVKWISVQEGDYILSLNEPAKAMDRYVQGHEYLEQIKYKEGLIINFQKKYNSELSRKSRKVLYFILYFIFAFLAGSPLFFGALFLKNLGQWILFLATCFMLFIPIAWTALQCLIKISAAEKFIESLNGKNESPFPAIE